MDWLWRCSHLLTLCALLILQQITQSNSLCSPTDRTWSQYSVTPPPSTFEGQSTLGGCALTNSMSSGTCIGPGFVTLPTDRLGDGNTGPLTLDDGTFVGHAWNQTVSITFFLTTTDTAYVEGLNLYFYNIPSRRIGLPYNIRITSPSGDHPYQLEGNDDLTLDDNGRRSVTLIPESLSFTPTSDTITIRFEFSDTEQIDWLLLTEVEICTSVSVVLLPNPPPPITFTPDTVGTISPPTINSSLSLSCSVTEGRFVWTWTRLTGGPLGLPPARVLNAGRTSVLELSQLSSNDAGTYQCLATYTFVGTFGTPPVSNSVDITLSLPGTLQAENGMIQVTASDESAVLRCFLSGYFPSMAVPSITWRLSNNDLSNDSINTITSEQGDMFIQNGGAQPIPSVTSTLTVNLTRDPLTTSTRVYNCISSSQMMNPLVQTIVLTTDVVDPPPVVNPPVNTTTPSPDTPSDTPETVENLGLIIGVIVTVIILLIIIIAFVIVIIIFVKRRGQRSDAFVEDYDYDNKGGPLYQEVILKPRPPPLPAHFPPSPPASVIGPYAVTENGVDSGNFELTQMNGGDRNSCYAEIGNPKPRRLKNEPKFLQDNPLYASADNLDRSLDAPNLPHRRFASVSSMDDVSNSTHGSILNIYATPFKIAPPVPQRPPTPQLFDGNVYSEALSPSMMVTDKRYSTPPGLGTEESCPASSIYADPQPLLRSEGPIEVAPSQVREIRGLGVGQFGQVVLAETVGLSLKDLKLSEHNNDRNITIQVAIKRLKPDADEGIKEAFEKEIKFMSRLNHKNVVRLLGICPYGTAFILMEYMENGDLNQYLHKHSEEDNEKPLSKEALVYIATQISGGMMYLATLKFIHRDLATRNCLVGSNNEVKIADFGMSRSLYSSYYYRIRGRAMLPIRWMANECFYGRFSEKTDIWAFGVAMWEIFTFCSQQPYDEMTDQEVIDDAIRGAERTLLERPDYCPPEVYEVMLRCWEDDPESRANFEEVHSSLNAIYEQSDL